MNGLRTAPARFWGAVDGVVTEIAALTPPPVAGTAATGSPAVELDGSEPPPSITGTATSAATSARATGQSLRSTRSLKRLRTGFIAPLRRSRLQRRALPASRTTPELHQQRRAPAAWRRRSGPRPGA